MRGTGACHRSMSEIGRPCPGPGPLDGSDPCIRGSLIGVRGSHAQRCKACSAIRNQRAGARAQKALKERRKKGEATNGHGMTWRQKQFVKAIAGESPRTPVKRCKVCFGDAHLRDPEREDDYGNSVCLPGMARCRLCWEPYAPLPEIHARPVLGSSAATAVGSCTW